jgi:hypothetical protein
VFVQRFDAAAQCGCFWPSDHLRRLLICAENAVVRIKPACELFPMCSCLLLATLPADPGRQSRGPRSAMPSAAGTTLNCRHSSAPRGGAVSI